MSSNGMMTTVVGWVATHPREISGQGVPFTSFRVASTPRYYDTRNGVWADGRTEWLTVKVFRDVALNVAGSIHKGEPVVVHGRLRTEEWESENGARTGLVIEASALGHDLTRGRATFVRTTHTSAATDGGEAGARGGDDGAAPDAASPGHGVTGSDGVDAPQDPWTADAAEIGRTAVTP